MTSKQEKPMTAEEWRKANKHKVSIPCESWVADDVEAYAAYLSDFKLRAEREKFRTLSPEELQRKCEEWPCENHFKDTEGCSECAVIRSCIEKAVLAERGRWQENLTKLGNLFRVPPYMMTLADLAKIRELLSGPRTESLPVLDARGKGAKTRDKSAHVPS